jgi:excisionase family DNA binding protein
MSISAQKERIDRRPGRTVSIDQAAGILGVSRRTVYNRIRAGRLQTVRSLGGSQRVLVDSLPAGVAATSDHLTLAGAAVARRPVS